MIFTIGEALIDKKNDKEFIGGGPLNVALSISRLNSSASFIGGISSDEAGNRILNFLVENCIIFDPKFCSRPERTMVAGVTVKDGKEEYIFDWKGSAALFMDLELLEKVFSENSDIEALYFGSITFSDPKAGRIILDFENNHGDLVSFFDPNIRIKAIEDMEAYKLLLTEACRNTDIVKMSDEDLSIWGLSEKQAFELCKHHLIITRGSKGATWYSKDLGFDNPIHVDGLSVPVVDTIGCGDCFSGAILHWLDTNIAMDKKRLNLKETDIMQALFFAVSVSAINACREGCNPPTLEELV